MRKVHLVLENSNASKGSSYNQDVAEKRGKVASFTDRENQAMSHVLRTLVQQNNWTQAEAGRRIDVNQQNAGKLINGHAGFSRPTAVKLAEICGFDSPETLLRDLGAKAEAKDAPKGWNDRDIAVGAARRMGYPDAAIEAVVAQYTTSEYASRKARWWNDRIVAKTAELEATQPAEPPISLSAKRSPKPVFEEKPKSVRKGKTG